MSHFFAYISDLDSTLLHAVQALGPRWLPVAKFLSYGVGSYEIMLVIFLLALFFIRRHRVAFELLAVSLISIGALFILKLLFHSPRPFEIDPSVIFYGGESGYGLPSGHALMSVVILGWVAIKHPKSHILVWGSVALIILIGASRVYLGVHYPSQVLAGWLFGIVLLYIYRRIDKKLWAPFKKTLGK
jgi:membrane-associated phospholipid phosphatase